MAEKPDGPENPEKKPMAGPAPLKPWAWGSLFLIILLFSAQNAYFIRTNSAPPYADSMHHLILSRFYYNRIFDQSSPPGRKDLFQKYPPVTYLTTALFYRILGNNTKSALWSLFPFSLIFIIAIFLTGGYLGGEWGAVACAGIASSNQLFMQMSHLYLLDMPQTAMTALAFYFLLKSRRFTILRESILFGALFALALLTKWSAVFYMIVPLLLYLIWIFRSNIRGSLLPCSVIAVQGVTALGLLSWGMSLYKSGRTHHIPALVFLIIHLLVGILILIFLLKFKYRILKALKLDGTIADQALNSALSAAASITLAGTWYIYNIVGVISKLLLQEIEMARQHVPHQESLMKYSLDFYLRCSNLYFTAFFLLAVAGVLYIFIRREMMLEKISLLTMAVFGVVIMAPLAPPAVFYVLSALIPLSVLGGYWLNYAGILRFPALAFILVYAVVSLTFPFHYNNPRISFLRHNKPGFTFALLNHNIPDPADYGLDTVITALDNARERIPMKFIPENNQIPVLTHQTEEFRRIPGMLDFGPEVFSCAADDMNIHGFNFMRIEDDWAQPEKYESDRPRGPGRSPGEPDDTPRLLEFKDYCLFILLGYVHEDIPGETVETVKKLSGRNALILKRFNLSGERKAAVIMVDPANVQDEIFRK